MKQKNMFIVMILFLLPFILFAQTENWVYRYNGSANDEDVAYSVVCGSDGNIYVAGKSLSMITGMDFTVISFKTTGDTNWIYKYDGPTESEDIAYSIVYGLDGNIYVAGEGSGMGTGHDFMVISLTTAGDTNWTYRYNGSANGYDFANSIVYGLDGNIYAAGHSVGEGTFYDFTVISIDTTGAENWVYTYNGTENFYDVAHAIVYGLDGNIYAAGSCEETLTPQDFIVISLTTEGDTNWTYRYNGPGTAGNLAFSIVYGSDDNIYAAGFSAAIDTSVDFTVISIDTTGTENWVYTYNGPGNEEDFAYSIVYGSDGNIYAAGRSVGMGTSNDFMVISLTTAGDTNWTYRYNGSANHWDIAKSIVYGSDGNLYVAGYASNLVTSKDFTVISLDTTGAENWVYGYSAASSFYWDEAHSIAYGLDGNIYAAGYSIYSTGAGIWDFTVISLGSVGVEEETALRLVPHALRLLVVYPNPFSKMTHIKFQAPNSKSQVTMSLYDAAGRMVKDFPLPNVYSLLPTEVSWNGVNNAGQKLPAGVYFLEFQVGDYKETRKLILVR